MMNYISGTSYIKEEKKKSKSFKFILTVALICLLLVLLDVVLIYGFANTLQKII